MPPESTTTPEIFPDEGVAASGNASRQKSQPRPRAQIVQKRKTRYLPCGVVLAATAGAGADFTVKSELRV
ncbi:MAG: hypothetical protein ACREAC_07750, partial [Blastocatellia bacterium]